MSDNVIQSIKKVLSQQNNGLDQTEIKMICNQFSEKANPVELRLALTDEIDGKDARSSLEGMMMYWIGDVELAAKVVAGSKTTPDDVKIAAVVSEIRHRDQNWGEDGNGWARHNDENDHFTNKISFDSPASDPNDNSGANNGYSSQDIRTGNGRHYDEYQIKQQETMGDLFGK